MKTRIDIDSVNSFAAFRMQIMLNTIFQSINNGFPTKDKQKWQSLLNLFYKSNLKSISITILFVHHCFIHLNLYVEM